MKLRCPRCRQRLSVPDKYAGRAIRCPSCNRAFNVPSPRDAIDGPGAASELDLEGLAKLETSSVEMGGQELADAQSAVAARRTAEAGEEKVRTCPNCNKRVSVEDPYVEVLCSHCWNPIPAMIKGTGDARTRRTTDARGASRATGVGGFYGALASSVTYPLSALGSLATAAGIAVAAGLVPVAVITGLANAVEWGAVGTTEGVQAADLSKAQMILVAVFAIEVVFFSAVALHAFLDVVRTTSIGGDRAPNLTWSPSQWGRSFLAYAILGVYLCGMTYLVALLTIEGDPLEILMGDHGVMRLAEAGGTEFLVGMVIVSFGLPMNLVGISLGSIAQGLHPIGVSKSIGRTHAHYVFLVLIVSVFGALFGTAFLGIIFDWFLPQVDKMITGSKEGNLAQVALSLLAWGAVMGVFFYGTYIVGRLHGLFARSFHERLLFGTR
ncbi:MAG: hypothetical protein JXQ75_03905 [Phycisphaerae bacterium]|nr:hypothetical protein [Phycisphaerae bacterium]